MSNKVKPWQNRKPRHHGKGDKRPHQRPSSEKFFVPTRDSYYEEDEAHEEWDEEEYLDE